MDDVAEHEPAEHDPEERGGRSLAEKLEHLLSVTAKGDKAPSNEEVATAINIAAGEKTISATYVWQLRTGRKTNPTMRHLEALAQYCGVNAAYFLSDEEAEKVDEQLALLNALKQSDTRNIALRSTGLSESSRQAVANMIDQLRKLEGLDHGPGQGNTSR